MTRGDIIKLIMDTLNDRPGVTRVHMEVDLETVTARVVVVTAPRGFNEGKTFTVTVQED